jgi:hypothetical protein
MTSRPQGAEEDGEDGEDEGEDEGDDGLLVRYAVSPLPNSQIVLLSRTREEVRIVNN